MVHIRRILLLLNILVLGSAAWGAPTSLNAYIGYVYPAGGKQGSIFQVTVRGQRLKTANNIYVSGKGVHATIVGYESPSGPLTIAQQDELKRRIEEIRSERFGGLFSPQKQGKASKQPKVTPDNPGQRVTLPDLLELRDLEHQTAMQLRLVADKFLNRAKRPKPPIAEKITLEVTIDPDAAPGDRELRLQTPAGLSNPLIFQVGSTSEVLEPDAGEDPLAPAQPPVTLNGQIMPGEVDRFPLQLKGGQKLIVAVQARHLIPYLADAVPGWFQAVAALYDPEGKEVAYDDDCGFDPDSAFAFRVPRDGNYTLAVSDALYRGREDFVYRAVITDESLASSILPSGSRGGIQIGAVPTGPNLSWQMAREHFNFTATPVSEAEPNNTGQTSMRITMPQIIGGTIASPGDRDVFAIQGRAGASVVVDVYARRMGSPLDSLVRLIDTSGRIIAWNDDNKDLESGLLTHAADSYLKAKFPANGLYFAQISDAQGHGGSNYKYFIRIGAPQPDFALRITPSALNIQAGRAAVATVYAVRKDGWDGDIDLSLMDAPAGFTLSGARIPKGRDQVRITVSAGRSKPGEPLVLHLEGSAQINGQAIARPVVPTDDMMQAFAYHHLVPAQELLATVTGWGRFTLQPNQGDGGPLMIPSSGSAQMTFSVQPAMAKSQIHLELVDPPAGVTLQDVKTTPRGFAVTLKADDKHIGYADNLIVEAFTEIDAKRATGGSAQKQRVSLGVLPAIPIEIVQEGSSQ